MTLPEQRDAATAWPAFIVEIDLDYVTSATSEFNDDGTGCYNTPPTSKSFEPLTVGVKTRRWVTRGAPLFPTMKAIPCIEGVNIKEEKLKLGEALGNFGQVTITLRDFDDDDIGEDPFGRNVTGRYLQRMVARNPFIQKREVRVWEGYLTDDFDLSNGEWRTYYARGWGNYRRGSLQLQAIGPLQLLGLNNTKCPAVSSWQLDADVSDSDTVWTITEGFYAPGDPTAGHLRIEDEYCSFTRSGATLTVVRGLEGTTADSYSAAEKIQPAAAWENKRVDEIIYDILVDYGNVDPALIPYVDWQADADTWLNTYILSPRITEPTDIIDLLNELAEQAAFALWWAPVDGEIKLLPNRPPAGDIEKVLTDDNLIEDPMQARDVSKRVSRADVFLGLRTVTSDEDKDASYRVRLLGPSVGAGEFEHDDEAIIKIKSRWFGEDDEPLAGRTAYTIANQLQNGQVEVEILVSKRDAEIQVGNVVELTSTAIVDGDGPVTLEYWVVSRRTVRMGHTYKYTLVPSIFTARYAYFADPASSPTYDAASAAERDPSCYFADTNGLMPNGDPGYSFA